MCCSCMESFFSVVNLLIDFLSTNKVTLSSGRPVFSIFIFNIFSADPGTSKEIFEYALKTISPQVGKMLYN